MSASLRPVTGGPAEVYRLLQRWVSEGGDPLLIRTSGSTGTPKDVVLSHAAVLASSRASLERLGGAGQWLSTLPATAIGGLQVLVRSILADQAPVFAEDHGSIAEAIAAMTGPRRYASFVPTQLHRLLSGPDAGVLAELDAILLGGAAAGADLLQRAADLRVGIVRTYGMSETSGGCVYDGETLDGVDVRIDSEGRIEIAGPVLFDGYAREPRTGEWFTTSDLGEWRDGRLRVLGRVDDVIQSGGVNVPLSAVEQALRTIDGIGDVAVVGVPDDEWGTRVAAAVTGDVPLEALREAVIGAGRPASWAPRQRMLISALPLLPGGKIDRLALRDLLRSHGRQADENGADLGSRRA